MRTDQDHEHGTIVASSVFPRSREAVRSARDWARRAYRLTGGAQAETCALLVSELATNAVEYAEGDQFEVILWASPVSVGVRDGSPAVPELRQPGQDDEHGRGLLLVAALSSRFEVVPVAGGGKVCRFWLDEGLPR
ncbi:ATP-binding protein [Streptomyces sp. NPDC056716]|uniref:ATP-binding protein n=1 Tax=unclassified Streptomyces TaxID=2593676 RepID=UPI00368F64D4